jgi:hypothetical protein
MKRSCARCGREVDWTSLTLVERLDVDSVRSVVTRWPDGITVEIRRCACGGTIARTASSSQVRTTP